jgi:hypothetical protein
MDPSACCVNDMYYISHQTFIDGSDQIVVTNRTGQEILRREGRRGKMIGGSNRCFLLYEKLNGVNNVTIHVVKMEQGLVTGELEIPPMDEINFNAEGFFKSEDNTLYVVYAASPALGMNELVNKNRSIGLSIIDTEAMNCLYQKTNIVVDVHRETLFETCVFNLTPEYPQVKIINNIIVVFFTQFRYRGKKTFGWDRYAIKWENDHWNIPVRLTENYGPNDSGYSVLAVKDRIYGFFPVCHQRPISTIEEIENGVKSNRCTDNIRNCSVEIRELDLTQSLPAIEKPKKMDSFYVIDKSPRKVVVDPEPLDNIPDSKRLIWGDLHEHTQYSKCESCNDGSPEDVLDFQRDVLGCQVLAVSDHVEYMSHPEITHVFDSVEKACRGYYIPLYGVEWAKMPSHHTNFFTIKREIFEELRILMIATQDRNSLYDRIKKELPEKSVIAIRHFHGFNNNEHGIEQPGTLTTFDPELELAMEAMQSRRNNMLGVKKASRLGVPNKLKVGEYLFPNNFLNGGAKIGLVGGSDHSRGMGINNFCLTGFWVDDFSSGSVFKSIYDRTTFGVTNGKIAMYASIDDNPMGSEIKAKSPVHIKAWYSSGMKITSFFILRDSEIIHVQELNRRKGRAEFTDRNVEPGNHWYVVSFIGESKCCNKKILGHCSPFFVEI